jgi:hypothetical protein
MRIAVPLGVVASLLIGWGAATAQSSSASGRAVIPPGTSESLTSLPLRLRAAYVERMSDLMCGEAPCAPATEDEIANPIVTDREARGVYHLGFSAWNAERCGLDWRGRSFDPMIRHFRDTEGKSERQIALITAIYRVEPDVGIGKLSTSPGCTDVERSAVDGYIDFTPASYQRLQGQ